MDYCEKNISVLTVWADHGLAHCFLDTVSSLVLLAHMLIFGFAEFLMYNRHGSPLDQRLKPKSKLYIVQQIGHVFLMLVLPIVWLILHWTNFIEALHGHHLLKYLTQMGVWMKSMLLTHKERHFELPSPPARGHGAVLLVFWSASFVVENLSIVSFNSKYWWWQLHHWKDEVKLGIFLVEYLLMFGMFVLGIKAPGLPTWEQRYQFAYGRLSDSEAAEPYTASASHGSTFRNLWKKLSMMLPYIWPRKSFLLQLRVLGCFLVLIAGRVVVPYISIYYKWIVNSLTPGASTPTFCWELILVYVSLRFAQGVTAGGFLSVLRSFLWIRVQQYTSREIQVRLYQHLHGLSLKWHLGRKTGEVLRIMDRGTNSINQLLSYLLFNILPTVADIVIAISYFTAAFNAWFGLIVLITMAIYLTVTVAVTEWRTKFRREMNRLDNSTRTKGVDSLLNFETVKYYNAEIYEVDRYRTALIDYQSAEWLSNASLYLLNVVQNFVITGGLLAGSLLCAYMVAQHQGGLTVGDYVLFATYIMQLYGPLNWLGTYYRMIQAAFIDMENMFDLLAEVQEVKDVPNASQLQVNAGKIEFRNVSFGYRQDQLVLKDVSFSVEGGKTVALVGPSGSGKSTVIRLLFRFYDVLDGQILFDDQDISMVTQHSLRKQIGVVPQDTVLFNDTIRYNIRYGRIGAPEQDVDDASKAAEIHDRILAFPDGYDTVVGERGLKLSGGEKQRVAIARTILKSPAFVLLDEATSALDTQTERNIQSSLNRVCAGKTTVTVAHRLSTIIHADEILVLREGEIVERGRHEDLLDLGAVYRDMWYQQLEKGELDYQNKEYEEGSA